MSDYMRPVYQRDIIRGVRKRFKEQYATYKDDFTFSNGKTVGGVRAALAKLDLETCSSDDVTEATGNRSWGDNCCDNCDKSFPVILRVGEEPDYEAKWVDLCASCLRAGIEVLGAALASTGDYKLSGELMRERTTVAVGKIAKWLEDSRRETEEPK